MKINFSFRSIAKNLKNPFSAKYYLGILEWVILQKEYKSSKPQLFILGLPRSGTTLIYQYLVHRLRVAYFTNGVGQFYLSPCLVTFIEHKLNGPYKSDFKSEYGKVKGPTAPREAGSFWGRFFGLDNYIEYSEMKLYDIHTLRNTLACIQIIFGDVPFVNKNVKHLLRIDAINKIFPNAYFIIVHRKLEDVAVSTLRGRYDNLSDPREWWSVKPPNFIVIKELDIFEQVGHQLISLQRQLEIDLLKIPASRVIRIAYDEFCDNPESIILKLTTISEGMEYRSPPIERFEKYSHSPQDWEEKKLVDLIHNV